MKFVHTLLLCLLVVGCAASGPKFSELKRADDSVSAVYIYRISKFESGGYAPILAINGVDQSELKNGGYLRREIKEGAHVFELKPKYSMDKFKPIMLSIETKAGFTYFMRYDVTHTGSSARFNEIATTGSPIIFDHKFMHTLERVDESTALRELVDTNAIEN